MLDGCPSPIAIDYPIIIENGHDPCHQKLLRVERADFLPGASMRSWTTRAGVGTHGAVMVLGMGTGFESCPHVH